jgi:hypothetical protein
MLDFADLMCYNKYINEREVKPMNKIDHRRHYYLMLDTETANTMTNEDGSLNMFNVLAYDFGWAVIDKHGNVYETASFVNSDIYDEMTDLMKSAYYAWKMPIYDDRIAKGLTIKTTTAEIKRMLWEIMERYGITEVVAHNCRFDYRSCNNTERFTTCSKYRYFFPYGTIFLDTMKMANDTICKQKSYIAFCQENGYITKNNQVRKTAEVLYRYISGLTDFDEVHMGLDDVMIEKDIFAKCWAQHKPMRTLCFEPRDLTEKEKLARGYDPALF